MFGEVLTAMITPFDDKNEVDYKRALELAQYLVDNGSDGIVLCGTTGESPTLSDEEKLLLFATIKKGLKGKAAVIAGTGSNSTSHSIELSMKAVETSVDGIMLITPYYNKPPQQGLIEHFSLIADAVPNTPIMLYNVPSRTGISLAAESVIALAKKKENIVALKEASGSLKDICQVIK
ncbi:MAG TPA: 4-hydroxy-tetrahydrodipicolinate synthase, partial [Firmicutes bacterium]|nr:4-hydroxy-tetrahydrodipicolinate synthase [Bacillota bacterium]